MAESQPIRVLIVDDHAVVREALRFSLLAYDDVEPVGEAADGERALQLCAQVQPDVVLMDLLMPGMDGITATRAIRQRYPHTQIVALTSFGEVALVRAALEAGALGYLLKNVTAMELVEAIQTAHTGRATLAPEATQALMSVPPGPPVPGPA
jgi:NarL family two-component system response regulator LiaR